MQSIVGAPACWSERRCSAKASVGVRRLRTLRGRLFCVIAAASRSSVVHLVRSAPLGKYSRSSPFPFSFMPRRPGHRERHHHRHREHRAAPGAIRRMGNPHLLRQGEVQGGSQSCESPRAVKVYLVVDPGSDRKSITVKSVNGSADLGLADGDQLRDDRSHA